MADQYCCKMMETQLSRNPCQHHTVFTCPDVILVRFPPRILGDKPRYGLSIKDGGESWLHIKFCPFCGKEL